MILNSIGWGIMAFVLGLVVLKGVIAQENDEAKNTTVLLSVLFALSVFLITL